MINFENRQVEFKNRKLLRIVDKSYNENGDLATLKVDVARCEGEVIKEGTELKAEVLNELLSEIRALQQKFKAYDDLHQYVEKLYDIDLDSLKFTWVRGEKDNVTNLYIKLHEDLDVDIDANGLDELIHVNISKHVTNDYTHIITFAETLNLKNASRIGCDTFTFKLMLFINETGRLLVEKEGKIDYYYESTNTGD